MAATGDTLDLADGTSFLIVESAADSGGERIEFEVTMAAGALGPPKHFHPRQHESWRILEGELTVFLEGEWRALRAGDSLTIAPDVVHTLRNRSGATVRFRDVHEPALDFQEYIEALHGLAAAGKLGKRITPGALVRLATVLRAHRTTQLSASGAQRAAETVLALVGRVLGYGKR